MILFALALMLDTAAQTTPENPLLADPDKLHRIDSTFRCPETLRGRKAKIAELERFDDEVAGAVQELTATRLTEIRVYLLRKHGCTTTLHNLKKNGAIQ